MIKVEIISLALFIGSGVIAQVGIDTVNPEASAALDITASNQDKGVLIPRLTSEQITQIANPAKGLLVYDTTENQFKINYGNPSNSLWDYVNPSAGNDSVKYSVNLYNDAYISSISVSPTYITVPLLQSEDWNDNTTLYQVDTSNHSITVTQAGRYRISVSVPLEISLNTVIEPSNDFSITEMQIAINGIYIGTPRVAIQMGLSGQRFNYMDITEVVALNTNDIISIGIKTTSETDTLVFYNSNSTGSKDDDTQRKIASIYLEQL